MQVNQLTKDMRTLNITALIYLILITLSGCIMNTQASFDSSHEPGTFRYDLDFLKYDKEVIPLSDENSFSQLAVVPVY